MWMKPARSTTSSVCSNSVSVSPGKPTMMSVVIAGRSKAALTRSTIRRKSSRRTGGSSAAGSRPNRSAAEGESAGRPAGGIQDVRKGRSVRSPGSRLRGAGDGGPERARAEGRRSARPAGGRSATDCRRRRAVGWPYAPGKRPSARSRGAPRHELLRLGNGVVNRLAPERRAQLRDDAIGAMGITSILDFEERAGERYTAGRAKVICAFRPDFS